MNRTQTSSLSSPFPVGLQRPDLQRPRRALRSPGRGRGTRAAGARDGAARSLAEQRRRRRLVHRNPPRARGPRSPHGPPARPQTQRTGVGRSAPQTHPAQAPLQCRSHVSTWLWRRHRPTRPVKPGSDRDASTETPRLSRAVGDGNPLSGASRPPPARRPQAPARDSEISFSGTGRDRDSRGSRRPRTRQHRRPGGLGRPAPRQPGSRPRTPEPAAGWPGPHSRQRPQ